MNGVWSALINGGIDSAIPAAGMWLALRAAPRRTFNAATRYLLWWLTLAVALALPILCALNGGSRVVVSRTVASGRETPRPRIASPEPAREFRTPALEIQSGPWEKWLLAAWLASCVLLLLRLARSYRQMVRTGVSAGEAPHALRLRAASWCAALGLDAASVRVGCSEEIGIPVAFGPRRRTILIPTHLLAVLSEEELDHVGLHESAHLARRDHLALLAQRTIEAVFCLHPVVRWIARQLDLEREIACDELAVAATGNPRSYAACLTRIVQLCGGLRESISASNFFDRRPHLSQRVELIMQPTRNLATPTRANSVALVAAALCLLAGLLATRPALVAFAAPQRQTTNRRYFIQGEVARPGDYPLLAPTRVLKALVDAGGFREAAKVNEVVVLRGSERKTFNYTDVVRGLRAEQNIFLMPDDIIVVR